METMTYKKAFKRRVEIGFFIVLVLSSKCLAGDFPIVNKTAKPDQVKDFFARQHKTVITFLGYSGAGYENEALLLKEAEIILNDYDSSETIVNIGATGEGIGLVYELAQGKGFTTTGIVSTQALKYNAQLSDYVEYVFYIEDDTWGGYVTNENRLSPTSQVMVDNSDILIAIGGGVVARDEIAEANSKGKEIHFIPAEMKHERAIKKAQDKGKPLPTDFNGAANSLFKK